MFRLKLVMLGLISIACCAVSGASAQGGLYLDDMVVKNDGTPVISENFDDGNVRHWYTLTAATVVTLREKPPARVLSMNKHGKQWGMARTSTTVLKPGVVEFSGSIWVAPPNEQYNWIHGQSSILYVTLAFPDDGGGKIWLMVSLDPKEQGCRVGVRWEGTKVKKFETSKQPVLTCGKWTPIGMRVDPESGTITGYVDNRPVASCPYDRQSLKAFRGLDLNTDFGDGSDIK